MTLMPSSAAGMRASTLAALAVAGLAIPASGCGKTASPSVSNAPPSTAQARSAPIVSGSEPFKAVAVRIAAGKPLAHAQWIGEAEAICARYAGSVKVKTKGLAELARVLPQQAAYLRQEIKALSRLSPPVASRHNWQAFLDAVMQWARGDDQLSQYAGAGPTILQTPVAQALMVTYEHAAQLARHDHLRQCTGVIEPKKAG